MFFNAARGIFPPSDGRTEILSPPPGPADAVVAFTGHHVIAAGVSPDEIHAQLPSDDIGAPMKATFLYWLSQHLSAPAGMLDIVLVAWPTPSADVDLVERADLTEHPRVRRGIRYRNDVKIYSTRLDSGILVLGRGLADRLEVGVEVSPAYRERGIGRQLALSARALVSSDEPVFAQIAPGNVASLRAFLRAGYQPVASEVLFLSRPRYMTVRKRGQ